MTTLSNKIPTYVSLVVYLHNNQSQISEFIKKADAFLDEMFLHYEIILVDDQSTDKTIEILKSLSQEFKGNVNLINLSFFHGNELAMYAGTEKAIGDFIFEVDSLEIEFPVEILGNLYHKCVEGFDIVSATPLCPMLKGSRLFYKILDRVSHFPIGLVTENIRIISRRAINIALKSKDRVRYRKMLYASSGYERTSIQYAVSDAKKAFTKKTLGENIELAMNVLISFTYFGANIPFIFSAIFFLIALLAGFYTILIFILKKNVVEGWATLMLLLSFGFSGLFFVIGIISKYVSIILMEVQDRLPYTCRTIETLSKKMKK